MKWIKLTGWLVLAGLAADGVLQRVSGVAGQQEVAGQHPPGEHQRPRPIRAGHPLAKPLPSPGPVPDPPRTRPPVPAQPAFVVDDILRIRKKLNQPSVAEILAVETTDRTSAVEPERAFRESIEQMAGLDRSPALTPADRPSAVAGPLEPEEPLPVRLTRGANKPVSPGAPADRIDQLTRLVCRLNAETRAESGPLASGSPGRGPAAIARLQNELQGLIESSR